MKKRVIFLTVLWLVVFTTWRFGFFRYYAAYVLFCITGEIWRPWSIWGYISRNISPDLAAVVVTIVTPGLRLLSCLSAFGTVNYWAGARFDTGAINSTWLLLIGAALLGAWWYEYNNRLMRQMRY